MAGIGFSLERLLGRGDYAGDAGAFLTAAAVMGGPWVSGLAGMAALSIGFDGRFEPSAINAVTALVTYAVLLAMLVAAPLGLVIPRRLADEVYGRRIDHVGALLAGAWLLHLALAVTAGGAVFLLLGVPPGAAAAATFLVAAYVQLWLSSAFVTMRRSYFAASAAFIFGWGGGVLAALLLPLGPIPHAPVVWLGSGLAAAACSLTVHLIVRLGGTGGVSFAFLTASKQACELALCGSFLAIGFWMDRLMMWYGSPHAMTVYGGLRALPEYDVAATLGLVSAAPAYLLVMIGVETRFARAARTLFVDLNAGRPRAALVAARHELHAAVSATGQAASWVQVPITLLAVVCVNALTRIASLPAHAAHLTVAWMLAAPAIVMIQANMLYLMYLDDAGRALPPLVLYAALNAGLTWLTIRWGYAWYGVGHLAAAWLAFVLSAHLVRRAIDRSVEETIRRHAMAALHGGLDAARGGRQAPETSVTPHAPASGRASTPR